MGLGLKLKLRIATSTPVTPYPFDNADPHCLCRGLLLLLQLQFCRCPRLFNLRVCEGNDKFFATADSVLGINIFVGTDGPWISFGLDRKQLFPITAATLNF